jgi:signal transduction histidine kinase
LPTHAKFWIGAVAACLAALIAAALVLPNSFALTALSDVIQCVLLFSAAMSLVPHVLQGRGRLRLFWTLMASGMGLWFFYQLFWTYYEVWLRTDVPEMCAADIVLFLHIVPWMAALALRPHAPEDEYAARLRRLDFALMMVWWIFLYVLIVIPWQYVVPDVEPYSNNLNTLYLIEKVAFLGTLFVVWLGSKEGWKTFYASLFGASLIYAGSSYLANWALSRHLYYSGSLYDIPLCISMAWITLIGLTTREREPLPAIRSTSTAHGVWLARLGMIAAFSLPLFAGWALIDADISPRIRSFRLVVTLCTSLLMGVMVFIRQRLLDQELVRLLDYSRESFANLKRLQAQITEAEKLASIGHLVAGAAHELNNPISATLGYSDLLLQTAVNPEQKNLIASIGQNARRTRSLVASLLSFARQGPATMTSVDLNVLLRTAVNLSQPHWLGLGIEVKTKFSAQPLLVQGDSNQLLQVCVQLINDALHVVSRESGRTLQISAERENGLALILISDSISDATSIPDRGLNSGVTASVNDADGAQPLSVLGLTACRAILSQHRGRIFCQQGAAGATSIRVEIPVTSKGPEKSTGDGIPVSWEPQPSA